MAMVLPIDRPATAAEPVPLLEVDDLRTYFFTRDGVTRAVDGISYSVKPGETLAIVGESGCGKSVQALSVLRLIASPPGRIVSGAIRFQGQNLLDLDEAAMRHIRGNEISMIFQEPMTSLNPVLNIGRQIGETLMLHQNLDHAAAARRAVEMLSLVHIPEPERRLKQYPHQLSGGMRQRVMIAMALACSPKLLIADEPTTALDVTVQAQILYLLRELQARLGMAVIFVTHDLGVAAEVADDVAVMYAGRIVEYGPVRQVLQQPAHPYTQGLMNATVHRGQKGHKLIPIPGQPPDLTRLPAGCSFAPRCPSVQARCVEAFPEEYRLSAVHMARCFLLETTPATG